jgi:polar amino acid transport system substrate-binding protein
MLRFLGRLHEEAIHARQQEASEKPQQGPTNHHACRWSLRATAPPPATDQAWKTTVIVARSGAAPNSADEVDRPGVKIAVAQGSAPHATLRRLIKNAEIIEVPGGFEPAREVLASGRADVYGENLHLAHRIADALPGARVLAGRFNVVQMAIGVRKRAASALPTVDEFVNRIRSDGTIQKAITDTGLRGVRVP